MLFTPEAHNTETKCHGGKRKCSCMKLEEGRLYERLLRSDSPAILPKPPPALASFQKAFENWCKRQHYLVTKIAVSCHDGNRLRSNCLCKACPYRTGIPLVGDSVICFDLVCWLGHILIPLYSLPLACSARRQTDVEWLKENSKTVMIKTIRQRNWQKNQYIMGM